ncbi:putative ApaG domain, F-box-like domain superfamily, ApaG domain superfamily protein [Helianthus annuus]|nr:F-box protein SKIP16 [Helianthus annuus]KAJ0526446.1 putative ApaG domain, F-box-like domain superfamily, ApaG domain superfamily protein [Helianthus annuus]KAJ0542839.1 putative ApaG domain, F-box-like domain superfamily, ApaG domain superfamily protein [Helianthus annuus]KAJ0707894.1 putative ApaG domain, F-box-like domain superfamily, ApaG domain superfamily protein [Helianthus annuus]KAJ0711871.1 putative ApaG domain, F-box-like domain superfamily, ApaG domain superfamily protein [Helian
MAATGLENIGGLAFEIIVSKLEPCEVAAVACVNKRFKDWASDESLWSLYCSKDLALSSPLDPLGNPCSSFKAAYGAWREAYGMYPWPLVRRVKNVWDRIRIWLTGNFPEVLPTLCKGASEVELNELEKSLKVKLPLPTRVLYRFCDGQKVCTKVSSERVKNLCGLIGGYSYYNYLVNVFLLPLNVIIKETRDVTRLLEFTRPKYIVTAVSAYNEKMFFLDCEVGQLYVGTRNLLSRGEMMPCVPNGLIASVHDSRSGSQQDAMLLWLEEHVRRLENGIIKLREEGNIRSISLFPEQSPTCSLATTYGVQVRASAVFIPEFSDLTEEAQEYMFGYSIRMLLKPGGCFVHGMSFDSCQLYRRHWIIKSNNNVVGDFNGEAVIGQFPLLRSGKKEFVYECCITSAASPGSIEGSYTFIPDRLADPQGSPFEVEVTRFPLVLP